MAAPPEPSPPSPDAGEPSRTRWGTGAEPAGARRPDQARAAAPLDPAKTRWEGPARPGPERPPDDRTYATWDEADREPPRAAGQPARAPGQPGAGRLDALIGRTLGGWRLQAILGQGAMGAVFRAEDPRDPRRLAAVKVQQPQLADSTEGRARFVREAKTLERVDHPGCCRCLGWGEEDGLQWLALELIVGKSLQDVLRARGSVTPAEAVEWTRQLLEGLGAAHAAGVVHRDVKLANAILGDDGRVRVVDFGLARRDQDSLALTAAGALLGTPHYMAPEQILGQPLDGRADLYSAGACLFHLLTGRPPFQAPSVMALLKKHLTERPPALRSVRADLSPGLERVVDRLLRKDRDARYPDARAAAEAVAEALAPGRARALDARVASAPATSAGIAGAAALPGPAAVVPHAAPARPARPEVHPGQVARIAAAAALAALAVVAVAGALGAPTWVRALLAVPVGLAVWLAFVRRVAAAAGDAAPRVDTVGEARAALARGDLQAAGALFARVGAHEEAGRAFERLGDLATAATHLAAARRLDEAAALWARLGDHLRAAEAHQAAGDIEAAAAALERAGRPDEAGRALAERAAELEVRRAHEQAPARLARIDADLARVVERACKLFQAAGAPADGARLLARVGRHRDAAELYREAGDRERAAAELVAAGDREEAAVLHERAGDVVAAARLRADALLARRDDLGAAAELERAGDLAGAARLHERRGDRERAAALLERAGEPARAAALLLELGRAPRAAALLEGAGLHRDAARAWQAAGEPARAEAALALAGAPADEGASTPATPRAAPTARPEPGPRGRPATPAGAARPPAAAPTDPLAATRLEPTQGGALGARDLVGRTIDRYRVLDVLGEGAFAFVLDAVHTHLERPVALKVLRPEWAARPDIVERFVAEARLVSKLRHPAIVEIHDFGRDGEVAFMALERVEGAPLRARMGAPWPVPDALALGLALLDGVGAAHQQGVVHRDLKPENVLVQPDGRPKILDFGLARVFWGGATSLDQGQAFLGTPQYAAPEAAEGKPADARADQYALGLILWELLAGRPPFRAESAQGWLVHQARTVPPAVSFVRREVPPAVGRALARALEKAPDARFPDVAAFAAALRAAA